MAVPSDTNHTESPWLKWFVGLLMGVITATVLVVITICFPSLEDLGIDSWMNLNVALASNDQFNSLAHKPFTPDNSPTIRYVFIDVDPGGEPDSSTYQTYDGACRALMKNQPGYKDLNCHPSHPLNRIVLAEVLRKVGKFSDSLNEASAESPGVLAIALDVILEEDPEASEGVTVQHKDQVRDRDELLKKVLNELNGKLAVFYVAHARQPFLQNMDKDEAIKLVSNQKAPYPGEGRVALLPDDSVVRRYHRCFSIIDPKRHRESLPYQLALSVKRVANHNLKECDESIARSSPPYDERIIYTLPRLVGHVDSGPEIDKRVLLQTRAYKAVYRRCLAAHLWDLSSLCHSKDIYENSIVVIGASNPVRQDQHYTPIGMMSGAEVVINATRSFLLYPEQTVESPWTKLLKKTGITFACSALWLIYYLICHRIHLQRTSPPSLWTHLQTYAVQLLLFLGTLIAVVSLALILTIKSGSPNLDILLPVLVIALEQYADFTMWLVESIKTFLAKAFGSTYTRV